MAAQRRRRRRREKINRGGGVIGEVVGGLSDAVTIRYQGKPWISYTTGTTTISRARASSCDWAWEKINYSFSVQSLRKQFGIRYIDATSVRRAFQVGPSGAISGQSCTEIRRIIASPIGLYEDSQDTCDLYVLLERGIDLYSISVLAAISLLPTPERSLDSQTARSRAWQSRPDHG